MRGVLLVLCFAQVLCSVNGYNIGLFMGPDSMEWHSLRHAVDQWNNENAVRSELSLDVVTPAESSSLIENKLCDLIQNNVVAVFVPLSVDDNELQIVYSMCHHFHVPCVTVHGREYFDPEGNGYVTSVAAAYGSTALASLELIASLRWRSFVLIYQFDHDVSEIVDLLAVWSRERVVPPIARVRKLPEATSDFQPFLKYIREVLKETNIIIHSNEIGLVHRILSQASGMNMTEAKYSYMVTNTDLSLLEDFLHSMNQIYHCNITGLQLVKSDPLVKTELALTSDAVNLIGTALDSFKKHNDAIESSALLCDAHDIWNDGERFNEAVRSMSVVNGVTGRIETDSRGRRLEAMFDGIGRINGKFVKLAESSNEVQGEPVTYSSQVMSEIAEHRVQSQVDA
uniref:ANF_receptor domain-containing protein n=1 Tax=Steinernema glaseri TaxID=37863 RepID=A0A1I8ABH8_9BILA